MRKSIETKLEPAQEEIIENICFCASHGVASPQIVRRLFNKYSFSPEELEKIKGGMIKGAMMHFNNYQNSGSEESKQEACRYNALADDIDRQLRCVMMY